MKRIEKKDLWLLLAQLSVWLLIVALPMLTAWLSTRDWQSVRTAMLATLNMLQAPCLIYFANFYLLHRLFSSRRYAWFALLNLVLIVGLNFGLFYVPNITRDMPYFAKVNMYIGLFIYLLLNCAMIATANGLRHFMRTSRLRRQLAEERQKSTEAELAWLKNQINPHFLFNTLNNISSLTQIDADKAQDAIAQLSDLLRYAMYETNKPLVSVGGEVEFMRNYIELMRLRCGTGATVSYSFHVADEQAPVAPLLFVSLIENAFKHGISSSRPSAIRISLSDDGGRLVFECDNTNYPKTDADRSGSGIGLENTRRRLELMYKGRYEWEQCVTPDNFYHIRISLSE